jgi:hypothetical protein
MLFELYIIQPLVVNVALDQDVLAKSQTAVEPSNVGVTLVKVLPPVVYPLPLASSSLFPVTYRVIYCARRRTYQLAMLIVL